MAQPEIGTGVMPVLAFNAQWDLADAAGRATWACLDAQRQMWQPWLALQAAWWSRCVEAGGWPGPAAWLMRGTEQLA